MPHTVSPADTTPTTNGMGVLQLAPQHTQASACNPPICSRRAKAPWVESLP